MPQLALDLAVGCDRIDTHISWVFLRGTEVFKVKKPVVYSFLDFSDIDKRRRACDAEVELNRRLAPSVYYGVIPITRLPGGRHSFGGEGPVVDWAVHMRRLADSDRADVRLNEGRLDHEHLDAVVRLLARFHDELGPAAQASLYGGADCIRTNIEENFEQTRELLPRYLNPAQCKELVDWQRSFVDRHEVALAERLLQGRVREGHGDLRLEHVYLHDSHSIDILDCIEFNERFRIADVCADIVFLAMDLARKGRSDLAESLLASYARESNDFDMYPLVDFYESYRAFVRGKIAAFVATSETSSAELAQAMHEDARRHFLLALASERRSAMSPRIVAVGGIIASGKSTVARHIGREMSAAIVSADRTRKHLAGIDATRPVDAPAFDGMYSLAFTEATYKEVIRRARQVVRSGRPVVLDASFRPMWSRTLARELADECGVPFTFVECKVDEKTCLQRLALRAQARGVSDGRADIFQDFVDRWEAVTELEPSQYLALDTSLPLEHNMEVLREHIPMWPAQLRG